MLRHIFFPLMDVQLFQHYVLENYASFIELLLFLSVSLHITFLVVALGIIYTELITV